MHWQFIVAAQSFAKRLTSNIYIHTYISLVYDFSAQFNLILFILLQITTIDASGCFILKGKDPSIIQRNPNKWTTPSEQALVPDGRKRFRSHVNQVTRSWDFGRLHRRTLGENPPHCTAELNSHADGHICCAINYASVCLHKPCVSCICLHKQRAMQKDTTQAINTR